LDRVFPKLKETIMARPPMFSVQEKQRIVLSVLRGEQSVAEAGRRNKCSETSIAKWRDQFVQAGAGAAAPASRASSRSQTHSAPGCRSTTHSRVSVTAAMCANAPGFGRHNEYSEPATR
jgi:transposase-like protein